MRSQLSDKQLSKEPLPKLYDCSWEPQLYDRWKDLPEDFVRRWSHLRAPVPSTSTKILRLIVWAFDGRGFRIIWAFRRALRFFRSG